jgi:hypothetical protein
MWPRLLHWSITDVGDSRNAATATLPTARATSLRKRSSILAASKSGTTPKAESDFKISITSSVAVTSTSTMRHAEAARLLPNARVAPRPRLGSSSRLVQAA